MLRQDCTILLLKTVMCSDLELMIWCISHVIKEKIGELVTSVCPECKYDTFTQNQLGHYCNNLDWEMQYIRFFPEALKLIRTNPNVQDGVCKLYLNRKRQSTLKQDHFKAMNLLFSVLNNSEYMKNVENIIATEESSPTEDF